MVFESLVVEVLNRILGDYFENLDTSQLNLGIWGGDVVLRELLLKHSAMDDLGLPFKVVVGKVGTLRMKIPWHNLYTAPVELNLQSLFLLVTPSYSVEYHIESEEKALQAAKQKEILRLDEARAREKSKNQGTVGAQEDTFAEKMITQIIKNVQIRIDCIHIRYEDDVTKPQSPFAFGIVMKSLYVETTDEDWDPTVITETVDTVNKMAKLEGLSLYWNSKTTLFQRGASKSEMIESLKDLVVNETSSLTNILGPITAIAKVLLTPNPDRLSEPFSKPKFLIDLVMEELALGLTNSQFQDIMELAEAIDFMTRAQFYRKYRPDVTEHKGNYKKWWKFAFRCVIEEEVRRKHQNWEWEHMLRHRNLCKTYADAYYKKLTLKKTSQETTQALQHCEKELDIFNITLLRKQIEMKVEKEGKRKTEAPKNEGWFSGWSWFGGASTETTAADSTLGDIAQKFEEALSPAEKAKLYNAIDYRENALPLDYPNEYEEYLLNFRLNVLAITVSDVLHKDTKGRNIMNLEIHRVETKCTTRPVKNGLKVEAVLGSMEAEGLKGKHDLAAVKFLTSKTSPDSENLLQVSFESNPLNSQATQRIRVEAQPIEITYHGPTVIQLAKCFTLPPEMQLSKLQAAAMTTLNEWKEQSAAGLNHLIDTRGEIDLKIHFHAPYLLIPQDGKLNPKSSVLVVDLGELKVNSMPRKKKSAQEAILGFGGKQADHDEEFIEAMKKVAYDTLMVELTDFQIFIALPGEDYSSPVAKGDVKVSNSKMPQTLLKSNQLLMQLDQSLIPDDPRFARLQLEGSLPLLDLDISEHRLIEVIKLLVTLPFPYMDVPTDSPLILDTIAEDPTVSESYAISKITYSSSDEKDKDNPLIEFIQLVLKFSIDAIKIRVTRGIDLGTSTPFANFEINQLQAKLSSKTFSSSIDISVGGLTLQAMQNKIMNEDGNLYLLKTPMTQGIDKYLFKMHMFSILPNCPASIAGKVKQQIQVEFSSLDVILHLEALRAFIVFSDSLTQVFTLHSNSNVPQNSDAASVDSASLASNSSWKTGPRRLSKQVSRIEATRRAVAKKQIINADDILLKIDAKMESFTVQLSSEQKNLIRAELRQMNFSMEQKSDKSVMMMELMDLDVRNLDPSTIYKDLIAVDADKVVSIKVSMYNDATKGNHYYNMEKHDMSVKIETGSPKIYYIARLVDEILGFIDHFAAAKEAVIDASTAAAAVARENVEQAYAAASRIMLDISLNAPVIFIPRNEKSHQGLLADLGHLTLKNRFVKHHVKDLSSHAIVDKLSINLTNMKISRIVFDKDTQNLQSEVLMLEPVNFKLSIDRNLSTDWYHGIPDMALKGTLENGFIKASNEDYDVLMACLTENIAYSPENPQSTSKISKPAETKSVASKKRTGKSVTIGDKGESTSTMQTILSAASSQKPAIYTTMEINISIPQLRVIMYQKGTLKLEEHEGTVERNEANAFADFSIRNIKMDMKSWNNGNMVCPIEIEEINLKDVRPGEKVITNLIQRKAAHDATEHCVAKFKYKSSPANKKGTTINLETTSLTIVLCLDYLLQILDFFSRAEVPDYPKPDLAVKYEINASGGDPAPVREVTADKPEVVVGLETEPEPDPFNGFYSFAETELILVESMESLDSNAILLNCEVSLKQTQVGGRSNMMGTIGNLNLSTCKYDPDNMHQQVAEVISPMSISLVMNYSEAVGTLVDVNISDIFVRLTAGTLELLMKIFSTVGAANEAATTLVVNPDHSNLWDVQKNDEMNYWFLNPDASVEVGLEALTVQEDKAKLFNIAEDLKVSERLVLESGCIVFTFETGTGTNTMPMVLLETDVDLQIFDWSTNMTVAGRMKLEAAYYNATFGMWEFIIEPVETRHHGRIAHQPWEMLFEYTSRLNPSAPISSGEEGPSNSYMSIAFESSDILEVTITKTTLEVVDILMDDFKAAAKKLVSEKAISTAAYSIENDTGFDVRIYIKDKGLPGDFILIRDGVDYEEVLLKHGTRVNLGLIESSDMTKHHSSVLREQEGKEERLLVVEIEQFEFKRSIPVNRASKRFYTVDKQVDHGSMGMICDTWVKDCSKIVTLRGVVQIVNDLQLDIDVYYKEDSGKTAKLAGTVISGQKFNLPIPCTYTRSGELFFAPVGFKISTESYNWAQALQELEKIIELKCKSVTTANQYFFMKVVGQAKQALHESTGRKNLGSQCCYIYLEPPLFLHNLLPVPLGYSINHTENQQIVERGLSVCVTNISAGLDGNCKLFMKIPEYNDHGWKCEVDMVKLTSEISHWTMRQDSDHREILTIGIHKEVDENEVTWHVYIPYWMINRTGLDLIYRGEDKHSHLTEHKKEHDTPILFSFPGKAFYSKKAACVKLKDVGVHGVKTDWSEKFSLDVAGSGGSITCKSPEGNFELGIEIQLSSWGLTKYVIFSPRYYLVNQCSFAIAVKETDKPKHETTLSSNACVPFWPRSTVQHLSAVIEINGKRTETKIFKYDSVRHTLLRLENNKYGGLHVDIHHSEAKTVVTFSEFVPGQAPVLLVNGTKDCPIEISEQGFDDVYRLLPNCSQLFTWKDPIGERLLRWSAVGVDKKPQGSDRLFSDGFGPFTAIIGVEEREYYWISFLDGLQRVLLFTPSLELATYLQAARENEVATSEYIVMLHGIGISLVDNQKLREVTYLRIASSEISWESGKTGKKKQRFRPLPKEDSKVIETAYQTYLNQRAISSNPKPIISLDSGLEIDFVSMKITKPNEKNLRRVFQTGIWMHYKVLPNSTQFHAKINRLQIDNQMHDSIFRVVFAPVPPPKSISAIDFPKPFAEVSIMQRINAHNYVQQFKYFKILVQEFHIRLDIGFINGMTEIFSGSSSSKQEALMTKFTQEYTEACVSLADDLARQIVSQGQKHFYDFLHFSPLKIHISFSMGGSAQLSNHFLNLVLASVGVTLTEIQDVIFKLSCLELQHSFLSGEQLYSEVYSHYSSQAIKQLYVLVLGLDVLGNPYGLALGVASGVEAFFYEPFHGAIQGPGEFAEGLALGMKSLLAGTVGGAAGAFSKITGTLGKGIAALTMDDEYQKKRRENMYHTGDAAEGLARSGKGLVMGFVEGITGVVTKPFQGAKEGVGGFFKGVGKGAIGLIARPTGGVIDFASGSFDAVKKCTSSAVEVYRMRPPRSIPYDSVIQPYVRHEAEGVQLISDLEKGRYANTDNYAAHALINPHGIYVLLITNKRLLYLKRDELFGGWGVEWAYIWEEFACPPDLVERGLLFKLKSRPHKKLKMFRSASSKEFVVPIYSADVCTWLLSKIEEAMKLETGMVFIDGIEAEEYDFP